MKDDRERCLLAGMDRYISKPVRAQELFESVEGITAAARAKEEVSHTGTWPPGQGTRAGPVFDRRAALARVGDDAELLSELAEVFLEEYPQIMAEIRAAVAQGDAARLRSAAHGLKGSVDNFAAAGAFEAALRLEMLGRSGILADVQEAWQTLEAEIDRLRPALADLARERPQAAR
jgi:HPt (histidine-containing phosphotransfer) domain-containing protein